MRKLYPKPLLILPVLFFMCNLLFAQVYTFYPSSTLNSTIQYNQFTPLEINIINPTNDSISLSWNLISNTLPSSGWDYSICDYGGCYAGIPTGQNAMKWIQANSQGYFKLNVNPYSLNGSGALKLLLYETGNQSNGDTVTFFVTTEITGITTITNSKTQFTIFPNPANNYINVILESSSSANSVEIFNAIGKKIMEVAITKNEVNKIALNDLPTGIYFIKHLNENETSVTKKFYKTN